MQLDPRIRFGRSDETIKLLVALCVASFVFDRHSNQHAFADEFASKCAVKGRAAIVKRGRMLHCRLANNGFQCLVARELEARHHGDLVGLLAHLGVEGAERAGGAGNGFGAAVQGGVA